MEKDIILVIDTTSNALFLGLIKNGVKKTVYLKDCASKHSVMLLPEIDKLLKSENLTIKDLTACAVSIGPGSFTGIRIGVATAKAFQYALNLKIITVNSLEAAAYNYLKKNQNVAAIIDAKHDNAYVGVYQNGSEQLKFLNRAAVEKAAENIDCFISPYENSFGASVIDNYYDGLTDLVIDKADKCEYSENFSPLYLKLSQAEEEENGIS